MHQDIEDVVLPYGLWENMWMPRLKNHRHETFAANYVTRGFNGSAAARAAGVDNHNCAQMANLWLGRAEVVTRIQELMAAEIEPLRATKQEIINECLKMATFNAADLYDCDGKFIPLHEQDRDVTMNVNKVKFNPARPGVIEEITAGKDKMNAIDKAMKYYNAYEEHQESGTSDIIINISEMDAKL